MDPIEEGKRYCLTYGSQYRNPYPRETDDHNLFERGWSQTLKKYPEIVARIDKKRDEESGHYQMERRKSPIATTTSAEAYRNAKGK